jgi:hypothetical protein
MVARASTKPSTLPPAIPPHLRRDVARRHRTQPRDRHSHGIGRRPTWGAKAGRRRRAGSGGARATIGLVGAAISTRRLQSLLFGLTLTDPITFISILIILGTAAVVASWAARAARGEDGCGGGTASGVARQSRQRRASRPVASDGSMSATRSPSRPYGCHASTVPSGLTIADVVGDPSVAQFTLAK